MAATCFFLQGRCFPIQQYRWFRKTPTGETRETPTGVDARELGLMPVSFDKDARRGAELASIERNQAVSLA